LPTWADPARLRPRWVAWGLAAVLVLDLRAVVDLRDDRPRCASGTLPAATTDLRSQVLLQQAGTRSGQDVRAVVRLENTGSEDVPVATVQAVVVAPAGREVLGWADAPQQVGVVLGPREFAEASVTAHLARCPGRPESALRPGWYELVVVVVGSDGRSHSVRRPLVVAR
jgi:hypothetical protein